MSENNIDIKTVASEIDEKALLAANEVPSFGR